MDVYAIPMQYGEFLTTVRGLAGVIRAEPLDCATMESIVASEGEIRTVSGGMRIENIGVGTCASCRDLFVLFCDGGFARPSTVTMEMVDDRGVTVGHDVPSGMRESLKGRKDLIWLTDDFVMYPEKMEPYDVRMVMRASRLECPLPPGVDPWVFYPSPTTADAVNEAFGMSVRRMSTVIVGVDGLEGKAPSVPVADVVEVPGAGGGHGEPASEHAFYRRDLVGEALEVSEPALADQDLHAPVVVEVDVDGRVHEGLVVVLHVGELVADRRDGVVVDHDDRADHPLVLVLPLGLGERIADQVPDGLGPAHVPLLGNRLVEGLQKLGLQGNADARDPLHDGGNASGCLTLCGRYAHTTRASGGAEEGLRHNLNRPTRIRFPYVGRIRES